MLNSVLQILTFIVGNSQTSGILGICLAIPLICIILSSVSNQALRAHTKLLEALSIIILLIISGSMLLLIYKMLLRSLKWGGEFELVLRNGTSGFVGLVGFVLMFFVLTCALYSLKFRHPMFYGTLEMFLALVAFIFSAVHGSTDSTAKRLSLVASCYIFIRGLDNFERGLAKTGKTRAIWEYVFKGVSPP